MNYGRPFLGFLKCVTDFDVWGRGSKMEKVRTSFMDGPKVKT